MHGDLVLVVCMVCANVSSKVSHNVFVNSTFIIHHHHAFLRHEEQLQITNNIVSMSAGE